jgi:hypothetical protein
MRTAGFFQPCRPHWINNPVELFHHFVSFISSAARAYAMRQLVLAAIVAFDHAWDFQFEVRTAHIFTGFGSSPLRYCHLPNTSFN